MEKRMRRFWQRVNDYGNDETRDPFSHSDAYHRHFQGYAERSVPKKNGRGTRIERIYTADYYKYAETDPVWRLKKAGCMVLFAAAVTAALVADVQPLAVNRIPAIGIIQILSFLPMICLLYKLILQVSAPRLMTIGERDASATGFRKAAVFCGVSVLMIATAMPVVKWNVFRSLGLSDWAAVGSEFFSGVLFLLLYFFEKTRKLEKVPNKTPVPSGANEIW